MTSCLIVLATFLSLAAPAVAAYPAPRLAVSANKRFLVTADGKPFFWLGDTAWELFHRTTREEARPVLTRVPADDVIVADRIATAVPGAGTRRFAATRDTDGTYAMVYAPVGRAFTVNMGVIKGGKVTASWFNPRTGTATKLGEYANAGTREFLPPDPGELLDWVLVLDDAAKNYPPPASQER